MASHVAIVTPPYDQLILSGRKKIEARLTRTAIPPFGTAQPGDRIHIKRSAGPFVATAVAARVLMIDALTPQLIDQLRKQYDRWICGADGYWQAKRTARFATLIWLRDVQPSTSAPAYKPQNMRAWYTLAESAPVNKSSAGPDAITLALTPGSLRQNYVRVGRAAGRFAAWTDKTMELRLADGPVVRTQIVRGMFRWRGWGAWFATHQLQAGDAVQFIPLGKDCFSVQPVRQT